MSDIYMIYDSYHDTGYAANVNDNDSETIENIKEAAIKSLLPVTLNRGSVKWISAIKDNSKLITVDILVEDDSDGQYFLEARIVELINCD